MCDSFFVSGTGAQIRLVTIFWDLHVDPIRRIFLVNSISLSVFLWNSDITITSRSQRTVLDQKDVRNINAVFRLKMSLVISD